MAREPLSVVITTFNSARTLVRCLESVAWAEDLVVLDSGSADTSRDIARELGARVFVQAFRGYAGQKQDAIDAARYEWVLLLDSDEALAPGARAVIESALDAPRAQAFALPRHEHVFWQAAHHLIRRDRFVRLFDRRHTTMSADAVHESPRCRGSVSDLDALLLHWGQPDIATKVDKLNRYSTLAVRDKSAMASSRVSGTPVARKPNPWRMLWYPGFVFWRQYLFKRHILNGWAGFIAARSMAFHALLKDAKRLEQHRRTAAADQEGEVPVPSAELPAERLTTSIDGSP